MLEEWIKAGGVNGGLRAISPPLIESSFARNAAHQATKPACVFFARGEPFQFSRVEPNAVARVAAVNLHIFVSDFHERAIAFWTIYGIGARLLGLSFLAHLLNGLLFFATEVIFFKSFLAIIPASRHFALSIKF
jgi:hypothetical protein